MTLYALDGTSNRLGGGPGAWTHVALMAVARARTAAADRGVASPPIEGDELEVSGDAVMYVRGVGSGRAIDKVLGGATGLGAKRRVRQVYEHICRSYADPDASAEALTIDITGFSRGAATALHLANVLFMLGIRRPRARRPNTLLPYRSSVGWIWFRDWPRLDLGDVARIERRIAEVGLPANQVLVYDDIVVPRIRFLGIYDAVSSFVLPMDTRIVDLQSYGFGFRLHMPANVANCSHAMALDERRKSFRNVRVHPATMMRARALRSNEVGGGAVAVAMVIGFLWLLYAVLPGSLGSWRVPSIVAFVVAIAVSFTQMVRSTLGAAGEVTGAGERTDVQHDTASETIERIAAVTGVSPHKVAAAAGHDAAGPTNAARDDVTFAPLVRVMAPGLGALFAVLAIALIDLLGGFDLDGVSAWDYLSALVWAFVTMLGLIGLSPVIEADTRSLRTRREVGGLAARRLATLAIVAVWALATWWLVGVATDWWPYDAAEPWLWRAVVAALALAATASLVAGRRPSAVARTAQRRTAAEHETGHAVAAAAPAAGAHQRSEPATVAVLVGMLMVGAWGVRRLAARGVELVAVPWWHYAVVVAVAALGSAVVHRWEGRHESSLPPDTDDVRRWFSEREAREVWFRGNHTDVGGGGAPGLGDHSLGWMASEAHAAGLDIDLGPVESALRRRFMGTRSDGLGPTLDPLVGRARRLILDGDLGHASLEPSTEPMCEMPRSMLRFNARRWLRGVDLLYDPVLERRRVSAMVARRLMSPHPPRFVGVLGRVPTPDGDGFEWTLETSAGLISAQRQAGSIDRWR